MPLRASPSRYRRLTQRNRAASSAETNGSGVRGARPNSLAVITVAGAEIVSALSPLCPPVPDSRGIVMIGLSGPTTRRSEEHTSELQSRGHLVCRLLLEKKKVT